MFHSFQARFILAVVVAASVVVCNPISCPTGWLPNKAKTACWHYSPTFYVESFPAQLAYCLNVGGRIVEPRTAAEYDEIKAIVMSKRFSLGPWVNFIYLDGKIVSSSTLKPITDKKLSDLISQKLKDAIKLGSQVGPSGCSGFYPDGTYSFGNCTLQANPFCERR